MDVLLEAEDRPLSEVDGLVNDGAQDLGVSGRAAGCEEGCPDACLSW